MITMSRVNSDKHPKTLFASPITLNRQANRSYPRELNTAEVQAKCRVPKWEKKVCSSQQQEGGAVRNVNRFSICCTVREIYKGLVHPCPSLLHFLGLMTEYTNHLDDAARSRRIRIANWAKWVDRITRPPPGHPDMHSRVPSNVVPSPVPVIVTLPETTHIHPSPTGHLSILQQSPPVVYSPDSHSALPRSRSRSNLSSKLPQKPLHSRTHPHSSNHSYPHPPARPSSNPRLPPTLYHSGSTAQRPRAGFSSHIGPHPHPHLPSQKALPDLYPTLNKRTQQNFHVG